MKKTTKVFAVLLALAMMFSMCAGFSVSAAPRMKSIKIVTLPEQVKFYRGTDWDYGKWDQPEDTDPWTWVPGKSISFLRNPGQGYYPDAGMINAQGLVIEVTYTDGSKKTIKYKETTITGGKIVQNIIISPENGAYKTGKMKAEVWLEEDYNCFATYDIEIIDGKRQNGDVNNDNAINSNDALMVLQSSAGIIKLDTTQKKYADMNKDGKINSSDALAILQKAVGK